MDVQSAICALVNLGLSLMAATLVFPGPPAEPATAAAPTSPWDPLFSLIGALWNHWKGSKSQQKDTPNAVKASIASAEQGLAQIQPLPELMFDSRDFRENAIQFAQMLKTASKNKIADAAWADILQKKNDTKQAYDTIYGKNSKYVNVLRLDPTFYEIDHDAKQSWSQIEELLKENVKAEDRQKNVDQLVINKDGDTIAKAGLMPDWLSTSQVIAVVEKYKTAIKNAKDNQSPAKASMDSQDAQTASIIRPGFSLVSLPAVSAPLKGMAGAIKDQSREQEPTRQKELAQFEKLSRAPDWITGTLAQTQSDYRTHFWETQAGAGFGAAVGFVMLLGGAAFFRSRYKNESTPQLDLLAQSLAFRGDADKELATELAALHLEISKYLLDPNIKEHLKMESIPPIPFVHEQALTRVRSLREELKKKN